MKLYQKTGCHALLVGRLKEVPDLLMNDCGEFLATLIITTQKSANDLVLAYRVFVQGEAALRVRQFGFVGLHLWTEGDFYNTGEIYAEKVSFLDFPESGEIELGYIVRSEKSATYSN